jgi:hypothetical protein
MEHNSGQGDPRFSEEMKIMNKFRLFLADFPGAVWVLGT